MKYLSFSLTHILILSLFLESTFVRVQAQTPTRKSSFVLMKVLEKELKENPDFYFSKEEMSSRNQLIDNEVTDESIDNIKKQLADQTIPLSDIKQTIHAGLIQEEQLRLIELKYLLSKSGPDKLDHFFSESFKKGMYPSDFNLAYQSAYNQNEKLEVIMQMLASDVSSIRSQNAKQIGLMSREQLMTHLEATGRLTQNKNKTLKIVIIVLTIAAAGFITWGVVSAVKTRHERKKKEAEESYNQQEQVARDQHASDILSLEQTFAERERLREEGYVWQVCSTTTTQKTSSCNYDYNTYSGNEVCVTRCLKQAQTGLEAMHTKTCLSAFIPNNCFTKNPTAAGYDDGYDDGYDQGYDIGYDRGYDNAYYPAYNSSYSSAYYNGYNDGYSSGFNAGYNAAPSSSKINTIASLLKIQDEREMGFQKGYSEGYSYALQLATTGSN